MYEYLDRRYALALYEVAEEKGKVDEYIQELEEICNLIDTNQDFYNIIKHPQISTTKKKEIFKSIFKNNLDDDILSFLLLLIDKDRILYLREKLDAMEKIKLERNNTVIAKVKSVIPLTKEEVSKLKDKLETKYKKKVIIEPEIDKSIIGGLYVMVGNEVIDGTIKSKLEEMKTLMLNRE